MPWTFGAPLLGGILIGLAASLLLFTIGRVSGISGILGGIVTPRRAELAWRAAFLAGLLGGGVLASLAGFQVFSVGDARSLPLVGVAGLLVGFGTQLANGCTSGHGVCGLSRFSVRSLVATLTFIATGAAAVFVVRHVFGGA